MAEQPRHEMTRATELVLHLARREVGATHRFTVLGAAWPLVRTLAQWAVLVFVFTRVVHLGVVDYPVFVLTGLLTWSWFSTGVAAGTSCLVSKRHLVFQPRLPTLLLPPVSVAVSFLDVLIALPVVLLVVVATGHLHPTVAFLPVLAGVQFVLMCGVVALTSAGTVYLRDLSGLTDVALTLLFYLTPVFYDINQIHGTARQLLYLNPMTTLVEGWRSVLIDGRLPNLGRFAIVAIVSVLLAAVAVPVFRRLEGGFVDEL